MQLKSHRTVEQIAKKHRLEVSFIKNQLKMGIPIEHEHTQDKVLATDIALQHLDEIPDYYTRLKKMEASAKKEHKKFKDIKEDAVTDLQRGITELPDASYDSIDNLMRRIMKKRKVTAKELHNDFVDKHNQTPDTWAKKNMKEEKKKTLRNTNPCWKGYTDIGTKKKNGKIVPNCVPVNSESTDSLTYDWDTPVRERPDRYCPKCEGQRQRIALARSVLQRPSILVLDEATSALDYMTEQQVCLNLGEAFREHTVFFITHRLSSIKSADLIIMMDNGSIVEQGTHAELMALQGRYFYLYQQQGATDFDKN